MQFQDKIEKQMLYKSPQSLTMSGIDETVMKDPRPLSKAHSDVMLSSSKVDYSDAKASLTPNSQMGDKKKKKKIIFGF